MTILISVFGLMVVMSEFATLADLSIRFGHDLTALLAKLALEPRRAAA